MQKVVGAKIYVFFPFLRHLSPVVIMFIMALIILVIKVTIVTNLHKVHVWQRGVGGQKLFGKCPFQRTTFQKGAFLIILVIIVTNLHKVQRHKGRRSTQLFSSLSLSIPLDRPEKNKIFSFIFSLVSSSSSRSTWAKSIKKVWSQFFFVAYDHFHKKKILSNERNFLRQIHSFQFPWLVVGCKKNFDWKEKKLVSCANTEHVFPQQYCSKRP